MILVPKRKLVSGLEDETTQYIVGHAGETVLDEISTGYLSITSTAEYRTHLKIPTGTDKYPNPP